MTGPATLAGPWDWRPAGAAGAGAQAGGDRFPPARIAVIAADPAVGGADVEALEHALARLGRDLPMVHGWLSDALACAELAPRAADGSFSSSSSPHRPATIRLSAGGDTLQMLESLVHETAHLYLYRQEAAGALVADSERRFGSPLRSDARPLRGILLALHACAYIAAAFAEAEAAALDIPARCAAQRRDMLVLFDEARDTVASAGDLLTANGDDFVRRTCAVARHQPMARAA